MKLIILCLLFTSCATLISGPSDIEWQDGWNESWGEFPTLIQGTAYSIIIHSD